MIMDNNLNNSQSQTWTDPITGESYPSGNPHADINSSRVIGASQAVSSASFNDPLPPGAVPQAQSVQQAQPVQQMPRVEQAPQMPQLLPLSPVQPVQQPVIPNNITKFCEHCGSVIAKQAVVCPTCGCQVAPLKQEQVPGQQVQVTQVQQPQPIQPVQVVVNNYNGQGRPKDKLTALLLCIFLGEWGIHRFYEGRIGSGILWMFTFGLFGLGWLYDVIRIACASNPYYVK